MRRFAMALAALLLASSHSLTEAQEMIAGASEVRWVPVPAALPKGAEIAVLFGDPAAEGPYVVRLKLPAGYVLPPHHHPTAEYITVLSGSFSAGMGNKLNRKQAHTLRPGGFVEMQANANHYCWANTASVIQIHGTGPFAIMYVNPADNPSRAH
ncbi:MAG: cupin domain-containing protein [Acetobacteraceae bacterium]|nr:cupin domain-containing protein [Acetobacteraceae bacterium]